MSELPILFRGEMVRAIIDGRKTQTRRIITPQPDLIYGLTDVGISVIHNVNENQKWSEVETDPSFPEQRLHGRRRWEDLFSDALRGVWQEGLRGLVSISRVPGNKRLFRGFVVPQKQEGNKSGSSFGLHGLSRDAKSTITPSSPLGRRALKLHSVQSEMGHASGAMAGCEDSRNITRRREALGVEIHQFGTRTFTLGYQDGAVQSEICRKNFEGFASLHLCDCKWQGTRWVKETFARVHPGLLQKLDPDPDSPLWSTVYRADGEPANWKEPPKAQQENAMPSECSQLDGRPTKLLCCPQCGATPFEPFLRGQVQRWPRKWLVGPRRPYCALICRQCKEIVSYENP